MDSLALKLDFLVAFIRARVRHSTSNRLARIDGSPIFDEPLIGIADGDDPIFQDYKRIIGPHHLTPREALSNGGGAPTKTQVIRVVSWILPITRLTRESNAAMSTEPSRHWTHTRHYGEIFNDELRLDVQTYLREAGVNAIAPAISDGFHVIRGIPGGPTSSWSERHAAYAAGLGTFGLCDGFLTPVGKAMRCGSVVVSLNLPATPRQFRSHVSACPYLVNGSCGECIKRCPVGAIGPDGHDKAKCAAFQDETLLPLRERHGVPITGCGLCQTGVPCESGIPQ